MVINLEVKLVLKGVNARVINLAKTIDRPVSLR